MKYLIDIGHPAHVHLYRNSIANLIQSGHQVVVTVKNITSVKVLLDSYNIPCIQLGGKFDSIIGKVFNQLKYNLKLWQIVRKHNIDLAFGSSITIAHVSAFSKMNSIVIDDDDDDVQPLFVKYGHPFCSALLSPDALSSSRKRKNTVFYPGYHELAYLHPKRFQPDPSVLADVGINAGEPFFIMRFNVFKAHHDVGIKGLTLQQKLQLIGLLKPHGRIFITTERDIEPELKQYQMTVSPEKAHSLMAFATMFIGDSQTMTSEAAVLGVPGIKCNSFAGKLSVPNQLEEYGLCYSFLPEDFDKMITKMEELISFSNLKEEWKSRRDKMLNDKIDVTAFMVWFIENYPASISMVEDDQAFWQQFK
jgi:uncharacterized protein